MAYTTATIIEAFYETDDGRTHFNVSYTGNAGEPPIIKPLYVNQSTSLPANYIRSAAMDQLALLNQNKGAMAGITVPSVLDTTTPLPVVPSPTLTSYMAASLPFTPGATPQDVFSITGSATKAVTVTGFGFSTMQTTAGVNTWHLVKRSTANAIGTSAVVGVVPTNAAFVAATAAVLQYTANPTAGALVGRIWSGRQMAPTAASAGASDLNFSLPLNITLTGTTQVLALNFNGAALPVGLSVVAYVNWS